MEIEVSVPLLIQKLCDLLAHERNVYSRSTVLIRITETKSVLESISERIGGLEKGYGTPDSALLRSDDFLSKLNEIENVIDTYIEKTELRRRNSFFEIMPPLIYLASLQDQIHWSNKMDEFTTFAKGCLTEEITESTTATDLHTKPTRPRKFDYWGPGDPYFVDLEDKIDELVDKLFLPKDQESDNVIAVTGNAGSGKTVLTKKIYNDPNVRRGFIHRAWVNVSEYFEARDILLNILTELRGERKYENLPDNDLELRLKSFLKGKRCLIVVDDVRTPFEMEKLSVVLKCIGGWSQWRLQEFFSGCSSTSINYTN